MIQKSEFYNHREKLLSTAQKIIHREEIKRNDVEGEEGGEGGEGGDVSFEIRTRLIN